MTIKEASEKLKKGEITSVKLTDDYLKRVAKINPKINAYITTLDDEALKMAEESDRRRKDGKLLSKLDGIPIAIKDNLAMDGTLTTAGSKILENFISPYDATVITKLKNAGVVILGKTNMDEFAMGSSTETSYFGPTKNPWDISRVPGGSSGGSAAAVSADLCVAALGSDTGGSIRQPASFCGAVGLKPTYGTVSRYGLFAMASSLDQIGPIAKTSEDAEIIFDIISGLDEKDSTSVKNEMKVEKKDLKQVKIGIPIEYFAEGLEEGVRKVIEEAIEKLKKQGAEVVEISLPNSKYALECYYIIMPVEVSSNLARYDGVKYGFSANADKLLENYFESRSGGFGDEAKRRIMLGTFTSSAGYIDQYYNKAQKVRALVKNDFDNAFSKVDFILGPVYPEVAFKLGEKTTDPLKMYLGDIYTIAVNLSGFPALSVPAGFSNPPAGGLPVGIQFIGPQFSDKKILNLGKTFEEIRNELPSATLS